MDEKLGMSLDDIIKTKKMTPKERAKADKQRQHEERVAQEMEEAQVRRAEKARIKEENHKVYLVKQQKVITESISKLRREVSLEFDLKAVYPILETAMQKHGSIEFARKSPIGMRVRFENEASVNKALRAKKIFVKLPVPVYPAEIKHHAVYFNAPTEMGDLDDDILGQIKAAMGSHGKVVSVKKKGRSVVIFFNDKDIRDSLISVEGNSEVTVEIGDHSVALHAGLPPNIRKRRKMEQQERIKNKKAEELARASGQPPPPKMVKSK